MKRWFEANELYPVYDAATLKSISIGPGEMYASSHEAHDGLGHFQMEVPDEVYDRWLRVMREFGEVQTEMRTWHKALIRAEREATK